MVHEHQIAKEMNSLSPIHGTAVNAYTSATMKQSSSCFVIDSSMVLDWVATHNQESIEKAVALLRELDLGPKDKSVHFDQLFGMSDNLIFTIRNHGYKMHSNTYHMVKSKKLYHIC